MYCLLISKCVLAGPSGTAFLYVSHGAMEEFWPYPRNHHAPWPDHEPAPNSTAASRVEVGTNCVANVVGLGEALKLWSQNGAAAREHVVGLANRLKTAAATMSGVRVLTPMDATHSTGLTTLSFDGMARENLMELVYNLYTKHNINVKFQ
jgi:selenocysteine lyase/cysteine desulfurase